MMIPVFPVFINTDFLAEKKIVMLSRIIFDYFINSSFHCFAEMLLVARTVVPFLCDAITVDCGGQALVTGR